MIPIECPKCGREGNVPPDRLNAKLTCRGCQAVFHLDNTGRMVMGAPGEVSKAQNRPHVRYNKPSEPLDLKETWSNIPIAAKVAVPVVLLGLIGWQLMPSSNTPDYESGSESLMLALLSNDKPKFVSLGSSSSTEAVGKWFDLVRQQVEKRGISPNTPLSPSLFSGNPDKGDTTLVMLVAIAGKSETTPPLQLNLHMVLEGGYWKLDGTPSLADAERAIATTTTAKK